MQSTVAVLERSRPGRGRRGSGSSGSRRGRPGRGSAPSSSSSRRSRPSARRRGASRERTRRTRNGPVPSQVVQPKSSPARRRRAWLWIAECQERSSRGMPDARLVQLDRAPRRPRRAIPCDVPPEERVDRRLDRVAVEPKRRGDRRRVAGIARLEAQARPDPEAPDGARPACRCRQLSATIGPRPPSGPTTVTVS